MVAYLLLVDEKENTIFFKIVDKHTGESLYEFRHDRLENLMDEGVTTLEGLYSLRFETLKNGARHCFVVDQLTNDYIDGGWLKPEKKEYKRGGRKTRVTIDMDKIASLSIDEKIAIVELSSCIKKDGSLGTKGGRKISEKTAINMLTNGDTTGYDVWQSLKDKGIINIEDGKIYLNNKYVFRG